MLSDTTREAGALYETKRAPDERSAGSPRRLTYLIDPHGRIAKVYRVSDVKTHPQEVLGDVRALSQTRAS